MSQSKPKLKALGRTTRYQFNRPNPHVLERFPSPLKQVLGDGVGCGAAACWRGTILIRCPEFTSLCPMTGQPDFATIVIEYTPDAWCVESKALKLYLGGFRNFGEFHEACIQRIAKDLVTLLDPAALRVEGQFSPRGGIPFWPTVQYRR